MKNFDPKLKEECGVFGVSNSNDSAAITALGLHALQHRGQEGCGIVSFDGKNYHSEKRQGLVGDHFTKRDVIKKLPGNFAIGHNRYSTTGETSLRNIQPFFADLHMGGLSIAHNGQVGIGTTTPAQPLHIYNGGGYWASVSRGNSTPGGSDPWLGLFNNINIAINNKYY